MINWIHFVEGHVRMVAVAGLLIVGFVLLNKYEGHRHDEAVAAAAVAKQVLDDQVAKNQQLAQQVAASQQAYTQLAAQMSTQNALIATQIAALKDKTAQQQKVDSTLTIAELAARWRTLISSANPQDVQPVGENLSVSGQAGVTTVQNLELVDSLHQEVLAGHTVEDNLNKQLTSCAAVNTTQAAQITGLQTQVKDQDKSCRAQLAAQKPTFFGRIKTALKSFGVGVGVGIALSHRF